MINALLDVAKLTTLRSAWSKVVRGKLARPGARRIGGDGQSLSSFNSQIDSQLALIASALRAGTYKFSALDPFFIPKPDGKYRVICAPVVADRVVQRAALDMLGPRQPWMKNPVSYGFVSHGGVEKAVQQAVKTRKSKPWVFKTDITKFFDNVDRVRLNEEIRRRVRQRSLHKLLIEGAACEVNADTPSRTRRLQQLGIRAGIGVRQGMPLSPFFANLFLADFDMLCVAKGLSVLRYADDLIFFAADQNEAKRLKDFCQSELAKIQLEIPELVAGAKSQIHAPDEAAEFLGVELAPISGGAEYQVRLGKKQFDAIKESIYTLSSLTELRRRNLPFSRFGNSMAARIAAYSAAYDFCANREQLDVQLQDWSRATMGRVAKSLGIEIATLSEDARWFLGLDP